MQYGATAAMLPWKQEAGSMKHEADSEDDTPPRSSAASAASARQRTATAKPAQPRAAAATASATAAAAMVGLHGKHYDSGVTIPGPQTCMP